MKNLIAISLISFSATTALSATGWYCEGFCHSHTSVNSYCKENKAPIAAKADDPVSAINTLRTLCYQRQDDVHCATEGWWVNRVSPQSSDSGITATIESACKVY